MNARAPIYLVVDRHADGKMRVVHECADPKDALEAAKLLRWAGTPAQILLASAVDDLGERD